jgi:RNA polymerase sigma factor for flagellar operon FliA
VLSLDAADGLVEPVLPGDADPETLLLHRERVGYLHHAVNALPDRLRYVIVAYFFEQRPQQDIAAELGVTPSRVSQLQAEALRLLHAGLGDELGLAAPAPRAARSTRSTAAADRFTRTLAARSTMAGRLAVTTSLGETRARIA